MIDVEAYLLNPYWIIDILLEAQYELALHFMKLHKKTSVWKKALKSIKGQKTNKDRAEEWMAKAAKQGYLPAVNHKW